MAAPHISASPTPGPSNAVPRDRIADALYAWGRENHEVGHVFNQDDLLSAGIIPDRDIQILLTATTYLVRKNLFKVHDVKAGGSGSIGWELVSQERAANYQGLSRDEHLVYACIDTEGARGIWTKTIKARLQAHAKVLERVYKNLEGRGLIKPMKSVKFPGRKMYIISSLQPNEEATGGAWFSEGALDVGLMDTVSKFVEHFVSTRSWQAVDTEEEAASPANKRKAPDGGFDTLSKGKSKTAKIDDDQPRSTSPEIRHHKPKSKPPPKAFKPFPVGHDRYPTLHEITKHILGSKITPVVLPSNAIAQLLEVMVYDDRLFKMHRPIRHDEVPDDPVAGTITMFRCFKNVAELGHQYTIEKRKDSDSISTRKTTLRYLELEDIGRGGSSEIPCMRCPAFDLCGEGGPVNVVTCQYFDEWFINTAEADKEAGNPWPGHDEYIKKQKAESKLRQKPLEPKIKVEGDPMTIS